MENKLWLQKKYNVARSFFYETKPEMFVVIHTIVEKLEQYIWNVQNQAAKRIQKTWRGFRDRKQYQQLKPELKKIKSAIVIQRAVREWIYNKQQRRIYHERRYQSIYNPISRLNANLLEEEIEKWNLEHSGDSDPGRDDPETVMQRHREVCEKLNAFYDLSANRHAEEQRNDHLCTQIDAIFSLLQNIPPLDECKEVDWILFKSPLSSDAAAARIQHKRDLKALKKPWWKKLDEDKGYVF